MESEGRMRAALLRRLRRHPALLAQLRGFAVVAVVCTAISMALFAGLRPWLGTQWANAVSLVLCSVLNTTLNRRLTFKISSRRLWWRDQRRGLGVMALALVLTSGSLWLLHRINPEPPVVLELAVIVLGNVASALSRFVLLRYWIFRRVHTARPADPEQASAAKIP
ncbi:GtrA family protein [Specibacter sp. NPDC057265]|uniref:GtrA family protein n=1 Tax=Specibacter sp. NPDC057265 TaxID=3346075 RepID=UPI00364046BA